MDLRRLCVRRLLGYGRPTGGPLRFRRSRRTPSSSLRTHIFRRNPRDMFEFVGHQLGNVRQEGDSNGAYAVGSHGMNILHGKDGRVRNQCGDVTEGDESAVFWLGSLGGLHRCAVSSMIKGKACERDSQTSSQQMGCN